MHNSDNIFLPRRYKPFLKIRLHLINCSVCTVAKQDCLIYEQFTIQYEGLLYVRFGASHPDVPLLHRLVFSRASFETIAFLFSLLLVSFFSFVVDSIYRRLTRFQRLPFYTRVCIIDDKRNKFAISRYKSRGTRIISHFSEFHARFLPVFIERVCASSVSLEDSTES